ncbi:MAG: peptidoglycan D,D-transpeptidase FtsI family protein [Rhodospirillales bacterium]
MSERRALPFGDRGKPPIRIDGAHARRLETARNRLLVTGSVFALAFLVVAGRLVELTAYDQTETPRLAAASIPETTGRGAIVDRNGMILATSLPTASLYADAREVMDPVAAADRLMTVLPDFDRERLVARLSEGRFVWIRRNLTPNEQYAVNRLGIPGLHFETEERRVYPFGRIAAHVLRLTDRDGRGIAGVEKTFDRELSAGRTVRLAVDVRVQDVLRQELTGAIREFRAVGAAGVVLDARNGELVGMVSLPDYDPNLPVEGREEDRFNRVTKGVYEMGSAFKLFTVAMALDSGTTGLGGGYDASKPLRVARHTIRDFRGENRWLSVPEILVHSSNIGAAQMALDVGGAAQRRYLGRLGLLSRASIELPETGSPLTPSPWRDVNTMTVGFGHGIAVTPLQLASAVAPLVNGGLWRPPSLLVKHEEAPVEGERVISARTSTQMRGLMRLVVLHGTGKKAEVPGYLVGGKTGTAEKLVNGRYSRDRRISSFVGAFPIDAPRYVVLAILDEPKGNKNTHNFATGGWVAAPLAGRIIERIAPMFGVVPDVGRELDVKWRPTEPPVKKPLLVAVEEAIADARGRHLAAN